MNAGELGVSLLLKAGDFKAQVQAAQERLDNVRDAAREAGKAMSDAAGRGTAGLDGLGTSAKKAAADLRDIDLSDWRQQFKATSEQFNALYAEMDALETDEARLYKALDKLEAVIQHNESDIATWLPREYELNLTYADENVAFSDYLKRLREEIRRETRDKIAAAEHNRQ